MNSKILMLCYSHIRNNYIYYICWIKKQKNHMKKIFVILAAVFSLISCQKESTEYIINAKIQGVPNGKKVSLKSVIDNNVVLIDTTIVKNGTFSFTGSIKSSKYCL